MDPEIRDQIGTGPLWCRGVVGLGGGRGRKTPGALP